MTTSGTMPAASRQDGPGRPTDGGAGPTGRRGPRPAAAAATPFSLTLPAPPTGAGGGGHNTSRERSDPPHCPVRAASPPGDHSGAERPGGRARRPPIRARTARPIDSGTCCRHDAYSRRAGCWSGPAPRGIGRGSPRADALPAGEVRPRQRVFSPSNRAILAALCPIAGIVPAGSFSQARDLAPQLRTFFVIGDRLRSRRR